MRSFSRTEIQTLFKTARRTLKDASCDFLIAPRLGPQARLLVVTPRAVGAAPVRNKVRRRLKSLFHEHALFNQPYDCIIIVKKSGALLSFDQWKNILLSHIPAYAPSTES